MATPKQSNVEHILYLNKAVPSLYDPNRIEGLLEVFVEFERVKKNKPGGVAAIEIERSIYVATKDNLRDLTGDFSALPLDYLTKKPKSKIYSVGSIRVDVWEMVTRKGENFPVHGVLEHMKREIERYINEQFKGPLYIPSYRLEKPKAL